ncbi:unnamed protein product [Prunus brigantina]
MGGNLVVSSLIYNNVFISCSFENGVYSIYCSETYPNEKGYWGNLALEIKHG